MIATPVRAVVGAPVTVTFTPVDSNGEPSTVDSGTVTVGVTRADGTTVVAPGAATTTTSASRSYTLTATATAQLDQLTVTWTASAVAIGTTVVDVVGNVFATLAEIRGIEPSLAEITTNPDADLLRVRREVISLIFRATGGTLSFVPRFDMATMYHRGERMLRLPHYFLRRVRWARYWADSATPTDVTASLLTGIQPNEAGLAILYDASYSWPVGRIVVGYEHGLDAPPADVKRQTIAAIRRFANQSRAGIDPRAISYTGPSGETQRFPTPGLGPWVTGIPEIDEVLQSWRDRYPIAAVA